MMIYIQNLISIQSKTALNSIIEIISKFVFFSTGIPGRPGPVGDKGDAGRPGLPGLKGDLGQKGKF